MAQKKNAPLAPMPFVSAPELETLDPSSLDYTYNIRGDEVLSGEEWDEFASGVKLTAEAEVDSGLSATDPILVYRYKGVDYCLNGRSRAEARKAAGRKVLAQVHEVAELPSVAEMELRSISAQKSRPMHWSRRVVYLIQHGQVHLSTSDRHKLEKKNKALPMAALCGRLGASEANFWRYVRIARALTEDQVRQCEPRDLALLDVERVAAIEDAAKRQHAWEVLRDTGKLPRDAETEEREKKERDAEKERKRLAQIENAAALVEEAKKKEDEAKRLELERAEKAKAATELAAKAAAEAAEAAAAAARVSIAAASAANGPLLKAEREKLLDEKKDAEKVAAAAKAAATEAAQAAAKAARDRENGEATAKRAEEGRKKAEAKLASRSAVSSPGPKWEPELLRSAIKGACGSERGTALLLMFPRTLTGRVAWACVAASAAIHSAMDDSLSTLDHFAVIAEETGRIALESLEDGESPAAPPPAP